MSRAVISDADFVLKWQAAATPKDVAATTGLDFRAASVRASQMRKRGVLLKKFDRGAGYKRTDVAALNALIRGESK